MSSDDPNNPGKPDAKAWLEQYLPFSLPDIPLLQTAKNLDQAIAGLVNATGRNLEARIDGSTKRISARGIAEVRFIEAGASAAVDHALSGEMPLAERAIEYALGDAVQKQRNREEIAHIAVEDLRSHPPESDADRAIDVDWLSHFADLASGKSNEEVQELWGRILSGEVRKPGSFSLRTLSLMAGYDQADARAIGDLLAYVFNGEFLFCWETGGSIPFDLLRAGEETGVVGSVSFPVKKSKTLEAGQLSAFDAQDRWISIVSDRALSVSYYAYPLTRPGKELAALLGRQVMPETYLMAFAGELKAAGFRVQVSERVHDLGDGSFALLNPITL